MSITYARLAVLSLAVAGAAPGQQPGQMSAREIFYAPAPAPAAPPKPADPKPAKQPPRAAKSAPKPAEANANPPVRSEPHSTEPVHASQPVSSDAASSGKSQVVLASLSRKPLGVRVSLIRVAQNGQSTEVAPDTSFKPGDRVRLNIQVSDAGYLYIINRGSSGTWTPLFPSPELANASNAVVPGTTYTVPPDRNFVVSDPPGEEKLFIILSRKPELDIDSLTLDMSQRESGKQEKSLPVPRKPLVTTMAANLPSMNDAMVEKMRNAYARDLIIEKVDEQTPGARKENAVYAVNPAGGEDSRVVLDAQIRHK